MEPLLTDIIPSLVPMVVGAIGSAIVWVIKALYKAKTDIDCAHTKIRELEKKLNIKE